MKTLLVLLCLVSLHGFSKAKAPAKNKTRKPANASAEATIRTPVDPKPSEFHNGKLLCGTKSVMFETEITDSTAILIVDGHAKHAANKIHYLPDSTHFTLQEGERSITLEIVLDPLMNQDEKNLTYCRLKMPKNE